MTSPLEKHGGAPPRRVLASLSLSMLMPSLDASIANAGLPTLAHALGASFRQVQWIVLAYLLVVTSLIVSAGRLGDLVGRRRLLLAGIALFTGASLLCGVAPTFAALVGARALQGVGAAVMMALTVALAGDAVPRARIGRAMGLLGTMSAVGTMLGPSLGGVLIAAGGWRTIFLVNVPLGLLGWLLARRALPADRREPAAGRVRFDVAGTLLLAATLGAYALAMTVGRGHSGPLDAALLAAAGAGAVSFAFVEMRAAAPLIQLETLRDPLLGASLAMSALVAMVMMTTLVVGPFYLARALGLAAVQVGLVLSAGPCISALSGVPAGRLVDRLGTRLTTWAGLSAMGAGTSALALQPAGAGVAGYMASIAVTTLGYALFQAANNTAIMAGVEPGRRGVVAGLASLARNLGFVTGASLMGAVFAAAASATDIAAASPANVRAGMHGAFTVAALSMLAALALAIGSQALARRALRAGGPA